MASLAYGRKTKIWHLVELGRVDRERIVERLVFQPNWLDADGSLPETQKSSSFKGLQHPNGIGNYLTRKAEAFQVRHLSRNFSSSPRI